MKTNSNSCRVHRSKGKQYTIFVPHSNKQIEGMVEELGKRFDCTFTVPRCADRDLDHKRCEGIEITTIRIGSHNDQDLIDIDSILGIVNPVDRKSETPTLQSVKDDVKVYGLRCKSNLT